MNVFEPIVSTAFSIPCLTFAFQVAQLVIGFTRNHVPSCLGDRNICNWEEGSSKFIYDLKTCTNAHLHNSLQVFRLG